jgi:hypothetical protein
MTSILFQLRELLRTPYYTANCAGVSCAMVYSAIEVGSTVSCEKLG